MQPLCMEHLSSKQSLQPLQQASMPVCQLMLHKVALHCSACQEHQPTGSYILATSMHSGMASCTMASQTLLSCENWKLKTCLDACDSHWELDIPEDGAAF